jgi:transcriptional regulator with XRE-family HTH domain
MLGSAVRMLREQERLSQEELGERAQLAPALIARIEAGEADPTWGDARRIAAALGTSVDRLAALVEELEDGAG